MSILNTRYPLELENIFNCYTSNNNKIFITFVYN